MMKLTLKICLFAILCLLHLTRLSAGDSWAERTLKNMSVEEKIGQLFMIAGYVDSEFANEEINNPHIIEEIDNYITEYHVGGIAYVGPSEYTKQIALTNHYQKISKYPILFAQDLEWGLSMRIKDGMSFPKNITLGAIKDNRLIYELGKEIGRQAKLIGVHVNLSPVLDVNIDPENIAINVRSFGESPQVVAEKGIAMIHGLQDAGIIASAKHFPGLGDISIDPHLDLPHSRRDIKRLEEIDLYPFSQAIKAGVLSIQTEHLMIPSLESDLKTPSSLSKKIVNDLLKNELGFKGLILSGALRMKALTNSISSEEIVLKAFLAGSDMLLMPQDFLKAYQTLKTALAKGVIIEKDLDEKVLKILQMKEKVNLDQYKPLSIPEPDELNSASAKQLKKTLYEHSVELKRDFNSLIPLVNRNKIAYVQLGDVPSPNIFVQILNQRLNFDSFIFSLDFDSRHKKQNLINQLKKYSLIILAVFPADPRRIAEIRLLSEKNQKEELKHYHVHGLPKDLLALTNTLQSYQEKIVVVYFGNPYGKHFFEGYSTFLLAHEPDSDAQEIAADILIKKCQK